MASPQVVTFGYHILERVVKAVESVRERMVRATACLDKAGVAYAVIGGNAVAAWVATKNRKAIRFTQDVDLLLRRLDMDAATAALAPLGFIRNETLGVEMFLDGPDGTPDDAVHILFAGEKVFKNDPIAAPDVGNVASNIGEAYRVLELEPLVQMKLIANRRKDQVHVQDMIRVGLIDSSWLSRFPPVLASRLKILLDDPNG